MHYKEQKIRNKKEEIRKDKTLLFFGLATILFTVIVLFYNSNFILFEKIKYDNGFVFIEKQNNLVDINNNQIFKNKKMLCNYYIYYIDTNGKINKIKENSQDNKIEIKIDNYQTMFIFCQIIENNLNIPKIYCLKNHEHIYEKVEERSFFATCENKGRNYYKCVDCSSFYYEEIESLGHNFYPYCYKSPSCTEDGYTLLRCDRCGIPYKNLIEKLPHPLKNTKRLVNPNCITEGFDLYTCSFCGYEEKQSIGFGSHSYSYHSEGINGNNVFFKRICTICNNINTQTKPVMFGGFSGVIYFPAVNLWMPVYYSEYPNSQHIVDTAHAAVYRPDWNYVTDHNYQGFTNMRRLNVGSIMYYGGVKYTCVFKYAGHNTGRDLITTSGVPMRSIPCGLYTYTCSDMTGRNITMFGWNRV